MGDELTNRCRAKFEAWAAQEDLWLAYEDSGSHYRNEYKSTTTDTAWEAWKAACGCRCEYSAVKESGK